MSLGDKISLIADSVLANDDPVTQSRRFIEQDSVSSKNQNITPQHDESNQPLNKSNRKRKQSFYLRHESEQSHNQLHEANQQLTNQRTYMEDMNSNHYNIQPHPQPDQLQGPGEGRSGGGLTQPKTQRGVSIHPQLHQRSNQLNQQKYRSNESNHHFNQQEQQSEHSHSENNEMNLSVNDLPRFISLPSDNSSDDDEIAMIMSCQE